MMSSLNRILAYVFDCTHRHTTWPRRDQMGLEYICCVDCGRELPYSTQRMSIVSKEEQLGDRSPDSGGTRKYGVETVTCLGGENLSNAMRWNAMRESARI